MRTHTSSFFRGARRVKARSLNGKKEQSHVSDYESIRARLAHLEYH